MESIIIKTPTILISPQKMNLAAGLIRRKRLDLSIQILSFVSNKGSRIINKLLLGVKKSLENNKEQISDFYFSKIEVNGGRRLKKSIFRAKGRTDRIVRRTTSLKFVISKKEPLDLEKTTTNKK
jgi:large subunit ribosomal protein L22